MNKYLFVGLLILISGCHIPDPPDAKPKFQLGQMVKHKVGGDIGIVADIIRYENREPGRHNIVKITYICKFKTDMTIGIDTASGAGLFGTHRHNSPSVHAAEECNYWELEEVNDKSSCEHQK